MRSGLRVKSGIAGTKLSSNPPRTMMMGYGVPTLRARIPKATMKKRSRRKTYSTVPISLIQRYSNTHGAASHPIRTSGPSWDRLSRHAAPAGMPRAQGYDTDPCEDRPADPNLPCRGICTAERSSRCNLNCGKHFFRVCESYQGDSLRMRTRSPADVHGINNLESSLGGPRAGMQR